MAVRAEHPTVAPSGFAPFRSLRALRVTAALVVMAAALAPPAEAQLHGQFFEVIPETQRPTVGDPVSIRFRLRLDDRDLLFDTVPKPIADLPPGVQVLSVEKLVRGPDRIYHGRARLAFYRPGRQPVPILGLPFMRSGKGLGTVVSDSASVEIVPVLAAGSPSLRDIKDLEPAPRSILLPLVLALAALLAAWLFVRRRRAPEPAAATLEAEPPAPPPDPFEIALARLAGVEQERWPARGEVARHYEAVADTLRGYLQEAERLPARERTTSELLWALPPRLGESGLRRRAQTVLGEADLVKFARRRPDPATASVYLREAQQLLERWHGTHGGTLAVR